MMMLSMRCGRVCTATIACEALGLPSNRPWRLGLLPVWVALLGLALCAARACADECGDLKVPGYTATRTTGPLKQRVTVTASGERIEPEQGRGPIQILTERESIILNPQTKQALIFKRTLPPEPSAEEAARMFLDRVPEGEGTRTTLGYKTPQGVKEWVVKSTCRPDGIFTEKQVKMPQGIATMRQTNIKPGDVPSSALVVPSDYQVVRPNSEQNSSSGKP